MTRIRIDIPTESRSVELDVNDHSAVRDIISQVWQWGELKGAGVKEGLADGDWILRIKRRSEQGRWWSEQEIKDYKDRESLLPVPVYGIDLNHQLC